jgi:hypothetical protein
VIDAEIRVFQRYLRIPAVFAATSSAQDRVGYGSLIVTPTRPGRKAHFNAADVLGEALRMTGNKRRIETGDFMRSALVLLLAIAGGFALGYFGRGVIGSTDIRLEFPDRGYSPSTFLLGCDVITEGTAFENRLDGPTANVRGGAGKDKLALNLSQDGQTLSVLYAYDVGHGATIPIKLDVHSKSNACG